jgi:ATP-dependent DNA helicase RecQ
MEAAGGGLSAAAGMAAATAARLLRRAAEQAGVRPGEGEPPIDFKAQAEKARRDRARLDTMLRFAFGSTCRTRFIYDYFAGAGRAGAIEHCGACDVCLGWRRTDVRPLSDAEYEVVRIALSAVARLPGRFGVERIAQVLGGKRSAPVLERGLDRIPTFGRLATLPLDRIKALLDTLLEAGLLERRGIEGGRPGAFVLALTETGAAVMRAEHRPLLAMPEAEPPAARRRGGKGSGDRLPLRAGRRRGVGAEAEPGAPGRGAAFDEALFDRLRAWRTEEARRRNVPAYVVFHDATLEVLAAEKPRDLAGLRSVHGVGPAKIDAYGPALLAVLAGRLAPGPSGT